MRRRDPRGCAHGDARANGVARPLDDHVDGSVDDPIRHPCHRAKGRPGDPGTAHRRRRVHESRGGRGSAGRGHERGPWVSYAARDARCAQDVGFQLAVALEQSRVRPEGDRHSEHDPRSGQPWHRTCGHWKHTQRSRSARLLSEPERNHRAGVERLGSDCAGWKRERRPAGRQRAAHQGRRQGQRSDGRPPRGRTERPFLRGRRRILHSIREAKQRADLVIVYQHNHVFGNRSFSTISRKAWPNGSRPTTG